MSEDQTSIQLIMPKTTKDELEVHAEGEGKSVSGLIRDALREYFERRGIEFNYDVRSWKPKA